MNDLRAPFLFAQRSDSPDGDMTPCWDNRGSAEAEGVLRDLLIMVRMHTGHDFQSYKPATIVRCIELRVQAHSLPNLQTYRAFMQANVVEAHELLKELLIGVTNFFRNAEAFDLMQRCVLPGLMEAAAHSPAGLRVWVAGCATGEEAYSLAMLLHEQADGMASPPRVALFATDIDEAAMGVARLGCYPTAIEADVSAARLHSFFDRQGSQYRVRKEVRDHVTFAAHNILRPPPFSGLDLISCRNLLIYLDRQAQSAILEMLHGALRPGGHLLLGSTESADTRERLFSMVDTKNRIFRANDMSRTARYEPRCFTQLGD